MADQPSSTQDLNALLRQSPFGPLLDIEGVGGQKLTVEDIFGNIGVPGGGEAFSGGANFDPASSPYGGNPFAGDNFWNLFAGGVNPASASGNTAAGGGFTSSSTSSGTPANPFATDESFWNIFGGGVNPAEFSGSNIPAFAGGNSPLGMPGNGSSTPVPEPSSVIGVAVIGLGIAATKFRQYQRRTGKAFNK